MYIDPAVFGPLPDFSEESRLAAENAAQLRSIVAADLERASAGKGQLGNEFDDLFSGSTRNLNSMPDVSQFEESLATKSFDPKPKAKQDILPWEEIEIPTPTVPVSVELASSDLLSTTFKALAQIDRLASRAASEVPSDDSSRPFFLSSQQRSANTSSQEAQRVAVEAETNRILSAAASVIPAGVLPPLSPDLASSLRAAFGSWSMFHFNSFAHGVNLMNLYTVSLRFLPKLMRRMSILGMTCKSFIYF